MAKAVHSATYATKGEVPIGVVIPTFNRPEALVECLRHLEAQTWRSFEVIVVDDGSTDETAAALEAYQGRSELRLRYLRQKNSGPAKARNYAVSQMVAEVCLLIGDDIFPSPEFVERHLAFHREHPEKEVGAVGLTRWCEVGQKVTPFMRWLDRDGMQFAYGDLLRGVQPDWRHFYTSNLSLKTRYLRENPFDERFQRAAMEDIELGYRLEQQAGLKMFFLPDAVAEHLHETNYVRSCRRMVQVGASAYVLGCVWPEFRRPTNGRLKQMALGIVTEPKVILPLLTGLTAVLNHVWLPNPLTKRVMEFHERLGYEQAAGRA
jgi:glycosyltransferase involved in cell wall biosynthesis